MNKQATNHGRGRRAPWEDEDPAWSSTSFQAAICMRRGSSPASSSHTPRVEDRIGIGIKSIGSAIKQAILHIPLGTRGPGHGRPRRRHHLGRRRCRCSSLQYSVCLLGPCSTLWRRNNGGTRPPAARRSGSESLNGAARFAIDDQDDCIFNNCVLAGPAGRDDYILIGNQILNLSSSRQRPGQRGHREELTAYT